MVFNISVTVLTEIVKTMHLYDYLLNLGLLRGLEQKDFGENLLSLLLYFGWWLH